MARYDARFNSDKDPEAEMVALPQRQFASPSKADQGAVMHHSLANPEKIQMGQCARYVC
jgi:hypothetical protein